MILYVFDPKGPRGPRLVGVKESAVGMRLNRRNYRTYWNMELIDEYINRLDAVLADLPWTNFADLPVGEPQMVMWPGIGHVEATRQPSDWLHVKFTHISGRGHRYDAGEWREGDPPLTWWCTRDLLIDQALTIWRNIQHPSAPVGA
jgi:hypothetical protein